MSSANSAATLRDLYEALDMLDARQTGAAQPAVIDLRTPLPAAEVGTLRHSVRTTIGPDWDVAYRR